MATVTIERIVAGGFGLARLDGRVLLVPMTAPGDRVNVAVPERGSWARTIRIVEPGPDRIEPICRHYGQCGGCDLMHLSYPAQVRAKREMVIETIERIGGHDLGSSVGEMEFMPNPAPLASRSRATWQPTNTGRAGYLQRGSHQAVEIDFCPILDPALETARASLRIPARATGLTNGDCVSVTVRGESAPQIEFTVAGERICGSAEVFFQPGTALLESFVRCVVELASQGSPDQLLELYSGVGLFTVPLARRVAEVKSVESGAVAVRFARENVKRAGLTNVRCHALSAEDYFASLDTGITCPDAVLVDPPRAGLSDRVVNALISIRPDRLVYVSCDPATFARDARKIVDAGYSMTTLKGFDLFPQTHHVELVAAFSQESSDPA